MKTLITSNQEYGNVLQEMEKIFKKGFLVKDRGSEVDKKKTLKLNDPNTEGGKTLKNETKSVSQSFEDKMIKELIICTM